jgi:hypothetical protein
MEKAHRHALFLMNERDVTSNHFGWESTGGGLDQTFAAKGGFEPLMSFRRPSQMLSGISR